MILNEEYSFSDVRFRINRKNPKDYDVGLCFVNYPKRELLEPGTALVRLDFPVTDGIFMRVWWMKLESLRNILRGTDATAVAMRREWQHQAALPKAKGVRTQILEIEITAQVYAWIGQASPSFNKSGGAEQVFLPNLAKGRGPHNSDFARLRRTYTLPDA